MKHNKLYIGWLSILGLIMAFGTYAAIKVLFLNSDDVFHDDDRIPWTLLIATYVFFVLTSTGATIVASLSSVFGFKRFKPLEKRAIFIGLITLLAGFLAMGLELGNPFNMFYFILTPNFNSPIFWMGFFYACLMLVLGLEFYHQVKGHKAKNPKTLPTIALVLEVGAVSTLGAVFGLIEARPNFFGEYIQIYFLVTAILSGISAIYFFSLITYKIKFGGVPQQLDGMYEYLSRIFAAILAFTLLMSMWRIFVGLYANSPEYDVLDLLVRSIPYRIEIFIGIMLPFVLMLVPAVRQTFGGKLIAAIMVFVGLGVGRMDLVMLGQVQPIIPKYQEHMEIVTYFPTFWEWVIAAFAMALMFVLYTLGEKHLKLDTYLDENNQ